MKHLRKAEQKCSETAVYRYFIGALLVLINGLKNVCKRLIRHTTELLMAASSVWFVPQMLLTKRQSITQRLSCLS